MSYLKFDKTQLVNLEYSLPKEIMLANNQGVYCNTTIVGCNTRKYHGLLVVPVKEIDGGRHVLLSSIQETIIQHDQEFNLGISKYPGEYSPKGHKYARWFETDPVTKIVYRIGGVVLQKEMILDSSEARIYIKYTLLDAHSTTKLRLKPFMAFRSIHDLAHSNMYASTKTEAIQHGFKYRMYSEYPELCIQISNKPRFVTAPDWYYKVEYSKEKVRGYDFHEDLFVPGYFELTIKKGQSIVVSAGLSQIAVNQIQKRFSNVADQQIEPIDFKQLLIESSKKYIQVRDGVHEIISGFPWFGRWGRHSIISLPGLLLTQKKYKLAEEILIGLTSKVQNGMFPDHSPNVTSPKYQAVDTSLWFVWAIQKYAQAVRSKTKILESFGSIISQIIKAYSSGAVPGVTLGDNGLLHTYKKDIALTWMDSYSDGNPITQRPGYAVEINALWFNVLNFAKNISVYTKGSDESILLDKWIELCRMNFTEVFWSEEKEQLADYVFEGNANWDIRPNMLFAVSLPYSPLSDDQQKAVMDLMKMELLTTKGLRTLSPRSADFKNTYEGDHNKRDMAYHQGTVWPWLLGFFAEGWLKLYKESGKDFIEKLLKNFENDMMDHGIRNVSEVHDGSPPHRACGAIAFAPSNAELLRIFDLLSK